MINGCWLRRYDQTAASVVLLLQTLGCWALICILKAESNSWLYIWPLCHTCDIGESYLSLLHSGIHDEADRKNYESWFSELDPITGHETSRHCRMGSCFPQLYRTWDTSLPIVTEESCVFHCYTQLQDATTQVIVTLLLVKTHQLSQKWPCVSLLYPVRRR